MGCCWSKEDDRFEDRASLLAKSHPRDANVIKTKSNATVNGHCSKPVPTTAPPSVAKPPSNGSMPNRGFKKPMEEVHPTTATVDLLGLDQPPSPPPSPPKANTNAQDQTHATPPPHVLNAVQKAADDAQTKAKAAEEAVTKVTTAVAAVTSMDESTDADKDKEEEEGAGAGEGDGGEAEETTTMNASVTSNESANKSSKKKKKKKGKK